MSFNKPLYTIRFLSIMKSVGFILKEARLTKKLTVEAVEGKTKIRSVYLTAIEQDNFRALPSLSYAKGFVKNYAEFLGLDSRTVLAFFRRQTTEVTRVSLLPKSTDASLSRSIFRLTPGKFLGLLVASLVTLFLSYFSVQYIQLRQPPGLIIESPQDKEIMQQKRVDIFGKTDPDATVTINGVSTFVRSDGKFFDQVALVSTINSITIVSTSRFGKTTTVVREVGYQP